MTSYEQDITEEQFRSIDKNREQAEKILNNPTFLLMLQCVKNAAQIKTPNANISPQVGNNIAFNAAGIAATVAALKRMATPLQIKQKEVSDKTHFNAYGIDIPLDFLPEELRNPPASPYTETK